MSAETPKIALTFAILGDCFVGKTSLVKAFLKSDSAVNVRESGDFEIQKYKCQKNFKGREFELILLDVAGQADYDDQKLYPTNVHVDCIILCYSLIRRTTYDSITTRWLPRIRQDFKGVPVILVGIKLNGRDERKKCISTAEAKRMCKEVKFKKVVECWIDEDINVQRAFKKAAKAVLKMRRKSDTHQCVLA